MIILIEFIEKRQHRHLTTQIEAKSTTNNNSNGHACANIATFRYFDVSFLWLAVCILWTNPELPPNTHTNEHSIQTDRPTDGRTDRRTHTNARVATTHQHQHQRCQNSSGSELIIVLVLDIYTKCKELRNCVSRYDSRLILIGQFEFNRTKTRHTHNSWLSTAWHWYWKKHSHPIFIKHGTLFR